MALSIPLDQFSVTGAHALDRQRHRVLRCRPEAQPVPEDQRPRDDSVAVFAGIECAAHIDRHPERIALRSHNTERIFIGGNGVDDPNNLDPLDDPDRVKAITHTITNRTIN